VLKVLLFIIANSGDNARYIIGSLAISAFRRKRKRGYLVTFFVTDRYTGTLLTRGGRIDGLS